MKFKSFLILLLISENMYSQIRNDSVSKTLSFVPRFAINIQRGYGLECGVFLNRFQVSFPEFTKAMMLPYESYGFYISTEVSLSNFDKMVIGPKVGWEFGGIGETTGSHMGAEFIYYTDFSANAPAFMIKLGLPFLWMNIGYGYTMYLKKENILKNEMGKHRLTLSYFINRKAKNEFNRLKENLVKKRQVL